MSILGNDLLLGSGDEGYNLTRSLRFRSSASAYLNRTPASAGNRKTWTWSGWVKRGTLGADQSIFESSNGSSNYTLCWFSSANTIQLLQDNGAGGVLNVATNAVFRDPSAWYHVVISIDTTQATANNRTIIYVNGVNQSLTYTTQLAQNADTWVNFTYQHRIGYRVVGSAALDAYLAEVNFIDGQALTPSSFGSTNTLTGVWQPARYTGTYGTNGFYLPFTDNSALTTSSNVGLGKDFSGNGNYWTTNNISITSGVTYDSMTDVPTLTSATAANFAVMNPLNTAVAPINGNLAIQGNNSWRGVLSTIMLQPAGLYYFEAFAPVALQRIVAGLVPSTISKTAAWQVTSGFRGIASDDTACNFSNNGTTMFSLSATAANDVLQFAINTATGNVWGGRNNTFYSSAGAGTGNPATGANPTWTGVSFTDMFAGFQAYETGSTVWANFGQRPFAYTPPTGFVALNTYNLPTSTIVKGNTVMDATLYTGNSSTQTVTNAGAFKPDFVWIKDRSVTSQHVLTDSVRGVDRQLFSSLTNAEQTSATAITSFNSNGFTTGANPSPTGATNSSPDAYVAWQWQAGQGSSSSNTNGTTTSTVSVNASAGFSIVTFTATNVSSPQTIGHGLGVAPSLVIVKPRNASFGGWYTYHSAIGATQLLQLNLTSAQQTTSGPWNNTAPTSSVFTLGTSYFPDAGNTTYVAYCWTPIAGYSAFGSYTGNGSADGVFVYTGFQPKWVLVKKTSATDDWVLFDSVRSPYNVVNNWLLPNSSGAELTSAGSPDILSNGFKMRSTSGATNASGATYIYMAFAETPTKFALAR